MKISIFLKIYKEKLISYLKYVRQIPQISQIALLSRSENPCFFMILLTVRKGILICKRCRMKTTLP